MGLVKFQTPEIGWTGIVQQISNLELIAKTKNATVSRKRYEKFCHGYIFQALKGDDFGIAFCKKFKIMDYILLMTKNIDEAKRYIEIAYIKDKGTA